MPEPRGRRWPAPARARSGSRAALRAPRGLVQMVTDGDTRVVGPPNRCQDRLVVLLFDCFGDLSSQRLRYHFVRLHVRTAMRQAPISPPAIFQSQAWHRLIRGRISVDRSLPSAALPAFNRRFQRLGGTIVAKLPLVPKIEDSGGITAARRLSRFLSRRRRSISASRDRARALYFGILFEAT